MKVYIDIETRSRIDLRRAGVYRYVTCPDFRILMAAWAVGDEPIQVTVGHREVCQVYTQLESLGLPLVAHNAQFERVCFSSALGMDTYLPPERWDDTQARAGEHGRPQSLDSLAKSLRCAPKDSAGTRLINLFSKPNRDGGWNDETSHPLEWLEFMQYCEQDVATLREIDHALGDYPTELERQVYWVDQRINDRGIQVDLPMARAAARNAERNQADYKRDIVHLTNGRVLNAASQPQMMRWVKDEGLDLPNMQSSTLELALAGDLTPAQRQVLEIRLELALAATQKYSAALDTEVDGLVRGAFKFYGAHTGRWSGRGVQLQNLPREHFEYPVDADLAIADLMAGERLPSSDLKRLVRPMFVGPFTVVDYAAIEARVIAWLAGEQWALEAFAAGRDIYVETAERMGGLSRFQGKIAVLALGYQGALNSLRVMGGSDIYYGPDGKPRVFGSLNRQEILRQGYTPANDEQLLEMVFTWRRTNQRIVRFWAKMEEAFALGGSAGPHIQVNGRRGNREISLPSGRRIVYQDVKRGKRIKVDQRTKREREVTVWSYWMSTGGRMPTYGGRLAENVTQAVARDLLAEALLRLEEKGYPVVAHIHDEVVIAGEYDIDEVTKVVCEPPDWATGLPIDGEAFVCTRYRKA